MFTARIFALFLTLSLWAGAAAQAPPPQQPAARGARLELATEPLWSDSGLDVVAGDELRITARGLPPQTRLRSAQRGPLDPAGLPGTEGRGQAADAPVGAVIGRIGERIFPIGAAWSGPAPASGRLMLGINLPPNTPGNAQPLFEAVVEHVPQPRPPPPEPELQENGIEPVVPPPPPVAEPVVPGKSVAVDTPGPPREPEPDWTLIGLIAAATMVALGTLLGLKLAAASASTASPPSVSIDPSLDLTEGEVTAEGIAQDGPEVRIGGTLEPGDVFFDGDEPAVAGEVRDG